MKPVLSQVLFKPFTSTDVTESGLFIPENARAISNKGTIVATGNGTKDKPMRLKVGDVAYRVQNWGEGFIMDGEIYFLMDAAAIIATE